MLVRIDKDLRSQPKPGRSCVCLSTPQPLDRGIEIPLGQTKLSLEGRENRREGAGAVALELLLCFSHDCERTVEVALRLLDTCQHQQVAHLPLDPALRLR